MIDYTLTDSEILAHLLEEIHTPTGRLITFGDVDRELGPEAYAVIVSVFDAAQAANPVLRPAWIAMSVSGMLLDSPSRLAMLDALAATGYGPEHNQPWPAEWVAALKALAITTAARWQSLGLAQSPTLATVAALRAAHNAAIALEAWENRMTNAIALLRERSSIDHTPAQLAEVFAQAWADAI
jgi:hypothetical protein